MEERFKSAVCVDLILKDNNKLLLMFHHGEYELPGGHLEDDEDLYEAMIRESKEELLINLTREELKIVQIFHHYNGNRINFIFEANLNNHKPQIGEKDKCEELKWVEINNLPEKINPKMKQIIENVVNNINYDKL